MGDIEDEANNDDNNKLHVVMFPWLGFSHILNFFTIAKFMAQKGHRVSFVTTLKNIHHLPRISLSPSLSSLITFVTLSMPKVEELAENAEAPTDIGRCEIPLLMEAFDGLEPELTLFLEAESPDWINYDMTVYWLPPLAVKLGISRVFFRSGNAWFQCFMGSSESMINNSDVRKTAEDWVVAPPWIMFPTKIAFRPHEALRRLPKAVTVQAASDDVSWGARVGLAIRGADAICIRHSKEFEPQWIGLLEALHYKPVSPVDSWLTIKEWLDTQAEVKSIVYVALGTEILLSQNQLTELALGLELSGFPFFWTLKIKMHPMSTPGSDPVGFPDGFLERTKDRGMVWTSWAPQLKILGHEVHLTTYLLD